MSMDELDHMTNSELLLSALVAGTARFEKFSADERGQVCINSVRSCCCLDGFGLPIITSYCRGLLLMDLAIRRSKE